MDDSFRFFPVAASEHAHRVDALYGFLLIVSGFFTVLIAASILYLSVKYRRSNKLVDRRPTHGSYLLLETTWTLIPAAIAAVIFVWGASLFVAGSHPPDGAIEIQVTGKQWMWKFQHPSGRREINELHVPAGRPVRLNMISEDVIHSMYVPAFRIKQDVLPGRYTECWFDAAKTGRFHLFCAEYCGTNHSRMTGVVDVMGQAEYEAWLAGHVESETPIDSGLRLFGELRCNQCHVPAGVQGRCPPLEGLYGREVRLADGSTVTADDAYLRESILRPQAKVVAGFASIMPSFEAQLNEEQVLQLIAYVKSLASPPRTASPEKNKDRRP